MHHPSEILAKKWAINMDYARAWYPTLLQMIQRTRTVEYGGVAVTDIRELSEARANSRPYFMMPTALEGSSLVIEIDKKAVADAPVGSVAVIPITGPVMRDDGMSSYGTETKARFLREVYANDNIKGVVLNINSGGGEVDGTMAFANVVRSRNKPVVALANSMAASAAYWIAMNSDTIMMNDPTAQVGSIGVMMTFLDDSAYWEKMGIKWTDIVADGSESKNKGYFDALKGKFSTIKSESLNPLREMFAQATIDARGSKIDLEAENVLSGKMYFAAATPSGNKSAIEVGLADSIGNLDDAVNRVLQLADTARYNKQKSNNLF